MTLSNPSLSGTEAHEALQVVKEECRTVSRKLTELERFRRSVREMNTLDGGRSTGTQASDGGGVRAVTSTRSTGCVCGDVVDAFDGSLNRCEDTSLERAMSGELGKEIASTILQDRSSKLSSGLKGAILHSVDERRSQLRVLEKALEKEKRSVSETVKLLESINESLVTEGSLIDLGFDELRQRHGTLIYLREDCEDRIQERQQTLSETTKEAAVAGLRHMSLIEYLYEGLEVEHPVLSTLTEAIRVCEENEMEVRKHICKVV
ncbi:MAG: DUF7260 family protein [Halobacteria archaeon]